MVHAVRARPARSGISDRPRALGPARRPASRGTIRRYRRPSTICLGGSSHLAAGWTRCNRSKTSGRRSAKRRWRSWPSVPISRRRAREGLERAAVDPPFDDPVEMLQQLDNVWDQPTPAVRKQIEAAAQSNDALLRQAAVEALGRLGVPRGTATGSCWATPASWCSAPPHGPCARSIPAHPDTPAADLLAAMSSPRRSHALGRHARFRRAFRRAGPTARDRFAALAEAWPAIPWPPFA